MALPLDASMEPGSSVGELDPRSIRLLSNTELLKVLGCLWNVRTWFPWYWVARLPWERRRRIGQMSVGRQERCR
jgi:hypothetical protein